MFQDITVEELLEQKKDLTLIDVRSPGEYRDFTIPGSMNIPLLDDAERAEIGTIYKQVSFQAAKDRGLEIISAKLPKLIKQFEEIDSRKAVFCWRGGMRSRTTATVLSLMGIRVYRLAGGIRSYRQWVVKSLEHFELKPQMIVINGYTGTGKTTLLHRLAEQGIPVLDIEGLAGHRGSIFGQIGLKPNNQKTFEALLLQDLLRYNYRPFIVMEAESKRIGKAVMPDFLVQAKDKGIQLHLDMPMEARIRHIVEDYDPAAHKEECLTAFERIRRRLHTPIAAEIERALIMNQYAAAVALLLEHYYDPRYEHSGEKHVNDFIHLPVENPEDAVQKVTSFLQQLKWK
ncbi:tRNA 2-selenouridine(34) synthase MnmH [Paenibacillus sp. OAS669]|uniref:tRNA 2-selenouridine(34) synthase MnmH n=1 Tax=Paenibacillus sp. OAS669 TaxID=2663821 RepID=UPI001789A871|nr:tRNA 2-selenouridine(34) synthase MnmH [Paenibacillus sp. OAS669]MBE1441160.1 tRNA 2-selenouridine synthase [Paenibacillus sp. OAS669]